MTMPIDLVLVRHGKSEGNAAKHIDDSQIDPAFFDRPSWTFRLTDRGIDQADVAGIWIRKNLWSTFDRYYVSNHIRAKETAVHLGLTGAEWYSSYVLREREWGMMDNITEEERERRFADVVAKRKGDAFYWRLPNGESIADLCIRLRVMLDTLHRECSDKRVVIVCHGEVMWAFRILLERLTPERFIELDSSRDPFDKIHNCQILHYTRRDPENGKIAKCMQWMKSTCPEDVSLSRNTWQDIVRPRFSNAQLLEQVEQQTRMVNCAVKSS